MELRTDTVSLPLRRRKKGAREPEAGGTWWKLIKKARSIGRSGSRGTSLLYRQTENSIERRRWFGQTRPLSLSPRIKDTAVAPPLTRVPFVQCPSI